MSLSERLSKSVRGRRGSKGKVGVRKEQVVGKVSGLYGARAVGRSYPTEFQNKVYTCIQDKIPRGYVTSYGVVARELKSSPRAVGQALKVNPYAPQVPCHRVIRNDMTIGGFKGVGFEKHLTSDKNAVVRAKMSLLQQEGVMFDTQGKLSCHGCFLDSLS